MILLGDYFPAVGDTLVYARALGLAVRVETSERCPDPALTRRERRAPCPKLSALADAFLVPGPSLARVHDRDGREGVTRVIDLQVEADALVVRLDGAGVEAWESADRAPPDVPTATPVRCGTIVRAMAVKWVGGTTAPDFLNAPQPRLREVRASHLWFQTVGGPRPLFAERAVSIRDTGGAEHARMGWTDPGVIGPAQGWSPGYGGWTLAPGASLGPLPPGSRVWSVDRDNLRIVDGMDGRTVFLPLGPEGEDPCAGR